MKWFWTIIAVLSAATAAWFVWSSMRQVPTSAPGPISTFDATTSGAAPSDPAPTPIEVQDARAMSVASETEQLTSEAPALPEPVVSAMPGAAPGGGASAGSITAEQWLKDIDALISPPPVKTGHDGHVAAPSATSADGFKSAPDAAAAAPVVSDPKDRKSRWGEVVPARKSAQPDGSTLFDERFSVAGKGTAEDPFVVTWDYLVSASETYQPRLGKNRLPERITFLDDKFVRVVGYVAFPILSTSPNEMLSMRSMWDGCCIGVPPTPYDAIEVRLKDSASPQLRLMRFGSVEGKLLVDPYVKGNWLLGLYVMDDAKVSEAKNAGL